MDTRTFKKAELLGIRLIKAVAGLQDADHRLFKEFGLSAPQYNVLRILRGAGDQGLCGNEVRERMLTPVPDTTRLLDRLEEAGLVDRVRDRADRRFVTARITSTGREKLAALDGPVSEMHEQLLGHMDDDELHRLSGLLEMSRARLPG